MRNGYRPERRNRNIGTPSQGHGSDNRMAIPSSWHQDRAFYEALTDPRHVPLSVGIRTLHLLVEPTLRGFFHPCTPQDVSELLRRISSSDLRDLTTVILRQPTRKQESLSPVWGRLVYSANLGRFSGPTVILEAQQAQKTFRWKRSLSPDDAKELARLRDDGHEVSENRREYLINSSAQSARSTQLYRTFLHELGHLNHLHSFIESGNAEPYWSTPKQEREQFAHRFADQLATRLRGRGSIPFERVLTKTWLSSYGLAVAWFEHE